MLPIVAAPSPFRSTSAGRMTSPSVYLARRMQITGGAPVSVATQAALANSALTDDQLEEARALLGGDPPEGYGFGDLVNEWVTRAPITETAGSVREIQTSLVAQGFLPREHPIDGIWSPVVNSAFNRSQRAAVQGQITGDKAGAASLPKLIEWLGYTLPSQAWKGVVGTVKGSLTQLDETGRRIGIIHGPSMQEAREGARPSAVDLAAMTHPAIGMAKSIYDDLFGEDKGETQEQEGVRKWIDALTPYEEYRNAEGGAGRAFMEDLDLLLTISAVGKGAKLAATGIKGGVTAIRAGGALTKGATQAPQLGLGRTLAAALRGNVAAGGALGAGSQFVAGGDIGDIGQGALVGAGASLILGRFKGPGHVADKWMDFVAKKGLQAQLTRPLLKSAQQVYTGASVAGIGGRLFGGALIEGEDTAIEKAIAEEKPLTTFQVPGVGGDALDWTVGSLLYPTQILPFRASELAAGFNKTLGASHLEPWIRSLQRSVDPVTGQTKIISRGKARSQFFEMGSSPVERGLIDQWHRLDAGRHYEAAKQASLLFSTGADDVARRKRYLEVKSAITRQILAEGGEAKSPLAKRLVASTYVDETILDAHLADIAGKGSGVDRWEGFYDASRALQDVQDDWTAGRLELQTGDVRFVAGGDLAQLQGLAQADALKARARTLSREAGVKSITVEARRAKLAEAKQLAKQARAIEDKVGRPKVRKDAFRGNLIPAREDYLTREQLADFAARYEKLARDNERAFRSFRKSQNEGTVRVMAETEGALFSFLDDLEARGAITAELTDIGKAPAFRKRIQSHLTRYADIQGTEVAGLPKPVADKLALRGYKAVLVGEDVVKVNDMHRLLEITGVNDYSRREAFFANVRNLGIDPRVRDDDNLADLFTNSIAAELNHEIKITGTKGLTGPRAIKAINKYIHDQNHPGAIKDVAITTRGPFKFRSDKKLPELFKVDVRELSVDDLVAALELERRAPDGVSPHVLGKKFYDAIHRGKALGSEAHFIGNPLQIGREIGRVLGVSGAQGFGDWMRTWHIKDPRKALTVAGAATGAAVAGRQDDGTFDVQAALGGAAVGAVGAYVATSPPSLRKMLQQKFDEGTYGYLPQKLHRVNMAARFALNPMWDASRYVEQNMLGAIRGVNHVFVRPKNFISKREWKTPYAAGTVSGPTAVKHMLEFNDELLGTKMFALTDDIERRVTQHGMVGFSPPDFEAAQAFILYNQGMPKDKILEHVLKIGRYGKGRSALEKSANFIFFPFSFQKKLLASLGDWMFSAPARALLVHEGFRRYHEIGMDEKFANFIDRYLPIADEMRQLNNLAFGASPGRFFLEGIAENKTEVGTAMQILSSALVPSGAATPLAQAAGKAGDRAIHFFSPVVVTGENLPQFSDILESFAPIVRDVGDFWTASQGQIAAVTQGGEPYYQQSAYLDAKRTLDAQFDYLARALGYKNLQSFRSSDRWPLIEPLYERERFALRDEYPTGASLADQFENTAGQRAKALFDIASDENRSPAEDVIASLAEMEEAGKALARDANVSYGEVVYPFVLRSIRQAARQHQDDQRFRSLYATYFQDDFGPLEAVRT